MSNRPLCVAPTCWSRGHHLPTCPGDCDGCSPRLALDGLRLCGWHTDHLAEDPVQLGKLYTEIGVQLGVSGSGGEKTSGTKNPGLTINDRAVEIRTEIRHTLVGWCRLIAEERAFQLPDDDVHSIASFVATSAKWLAAAEFADEVSNEFTSLIRRAHRIAYPSGARVFEVAPCPQDGCEGTIKAIVRRTDSLLPSALVCDVDEDHHWPADQWLTLGRKLRRAA